VHFIVQTIIPGRVYPPKIHTDQTRAQKAFVTLIREHCAVAFAKYCTDNEADSESFGAAREFADSLSGDDIRFCYWELTPEGEDGTAKRLPIPAKNRESLLQAASETQQKILGVQTELHNMAEKLSGMGQELFRLQNLLGEDEGVADREEDSAEADLAAPEPTALDEKYQTAEWQDFVQSLIRMCGGNWSEFPLLSRQDWRNAVYSNQTALQYWEWAAITIDQSIERAKTSGYKVEEDGEKRGYFAYLTPTAERSAVLYELEDLAWCAAGLHAAQEDNTLA